MPRQWRRAAPATNQGATKEEITMRNLTRITCPALAFALVSTALFAGGPAYADDAMKTDAMKSTDTMKAGDAMKPADNMKADKMMKDCMDKAAMETDSMKKDEATKACDAMAPAKAN
jgi:pentapeptide MXKDX repeat protein